MRITLLPKQLVHEKLDKVFDAAMIEGQDINLETTLQSLLFCGRHVTDDHIFITDNYITNIFTFNVDKDSENNNYAELKNIYGPVTISDFDLNSIKTLVISDLELECDALEAKFETKRNEDTGRLDIIVDVETDELQLLRISSIKAFDLQFIKIVPERDIDESSFYHSMGMHKSMQDPDYHEALSLLKIEKSAEYKSPSGESFKVVKGFNNSLNTIDIVSNRNRIILFYYDSLSNINEDIAHLVLHEVKNHIKMPEYCSYEIRVVSNDSEAPKVAMVFTPL